MTGKEWLSQKQIECERKEGFQERSESRVKKGCHVMTYKTKRKRLGGMRLVDLMFESADTQQGKEDLSSLELTTTADACQYSWLRKKKNCFTVHIYFSQFHFCQRHIIYHAQSLLRL